MRGHVETDDVGAVARQHLGDRRADPARGAGHERDLAGERPLPVEPAGSHRGGGPIRTTWPDT